MSKDDRKNPRGHPPDVPLPPDLAHLRCQAEQKAQALNPEIDTQWPAEARRMLQELRMRQIELEMHNEALGSARERLAASRARYFDLYDLAPVGYCTISREGLILEANLTAATLFGVVRSALAGQRLSRFIFKGDEDIFYFLVRNLSITGRPQSCELRMTKKDAELFWARLDVALGVDEGGAPGWSIVISDITEHKRVEQALRESEERFRRIFEEGPLGLALVGRDYRFVKVNSALCKMVGYSEEVLLQMSFTDITHPDDLGDDVELAKRLFRREIPSYRMQKRYMKKNGEIIWINLTASIILDHDGEPLYGLAMIENITEVKRTQEEALARQKLESLGTLAGGIAHDFNNLLGGVLTQSELALTELDAGSSCKEELKAIREAAIRGSEIVRQLMTYAGKESEAIGWVDLSKIVEQMLALLKVSVSKHAVMRADLAPELPAIRANPAQLRQIVMNLITNASDAVGDRDGVIRVITRRATLRGESAVSESLPAGDYLSLEVSDTGSGMSPETQRRVFDPFFTTKSAGRGLGLAVVSGIVRSLGGEIRLTSEPRKGSTFRVLLPCAETTGTPTNCPMSANEESAGPLPDAVVLVVEDEDPLRRAVAKMLRQRGFEVLEAADGSVAINLLRANRGKIDVILLDMTIPGASSREVVAEGANVRADIRVVLTSAYSEEMLTPLMSASQIRGFIRKPFQFVDLAQTLRNALST